MRMRLTTVLIAALLLAVSAGAHADVQGLGADFWAWRAATQPDTGDDIPRIVRPDGFTPDWSQKAVAERYKALTAFEARWQALAGQERTASQEVDYRLLGSALARVRWELDHVAAWKRQPGFYVQQALGPVFEVLLPPPPVGAERIAQVVHLLEHVPGTLAAAQENLTDMRGPFVQATFPMLGRVPDSVRGMVAGLAPYVKGREARKLKATAEKAISAFAAYEQFLQKAVSTNLSRETAVGRDSYAFFLNKVALYPYSPEEVARMGEQEWARIVAFEALEKQRNRDVPALEMKMDIGEVVASVNKRELEVRAFLKDRGFLTIDDWVGHYKAQAFPAYLLPIGWLGRTFDLTSVDRLDENATVYIPEPSGQMGYFNSTFTQDPRPVIVHEGVPGHYLQLAIGWAHPNPLRRHYYDSGANEGTGFYAEEMMLQAGLFEDSPKSREIIYNFSRLRALRVDVDVKLALGIYSLEDAAEVLKSKVPMDPATALHEAVFFSATPGQALSYQIGKLQMIEFMSEARMKEGEAFSIQAFHDYVWQNGNVPIELQKLEYFSDPGQTKTNW